MQALPYLQLRESESPLSSEKKSYRLSLHETSAKTAQHSNGQTRSGKNVNRSVYSWETTSMQFEGSNSVYFGDIPQFRTPLPSPSPSKILKPSPKVQNQSSLPVWVEPLGVWLTNRKKCNGYETFTRNMDLLQRTSDMYLDPCPHIPRCSHERTLSALRRQKQRFKTEEEFTRQERHIRIIERVGQFRELWEQWTNKAKSVGGEHEGRLNSFRKSRDGYSDPDKIIRKKREERIKREKQIRLESEKKREELLRKKRFRLPKIIVTYYDVKEERRPESQCSNLDKKTKLLNLINIPSGEHNKGNESDGESQGSKNDRLELPEQERYCLEGDSIDTSSTQHGEGSEPVLLDNKTELEAGTDLNSHEDDVGAEMQNDVLEDKFEEVLEEESGDKTQNVLEDELSEDKHENFLEKGLGAGNENVSEDESLDDKNENGLEGVPLSETTESENGQWLKNENAKTVERDLLSSEQDETLEKPDEQDNGDSKNTAENHEEKDIERKVKEKENEDEEVNREIQMNYLLPPSVPVMTGENGPNGLISDADDTASLMGAFIPVAMGVGNGIIPNDAMRASSVFNRYHVPSQARLNNTKQGKNAGAWKPRVNDEKQYLEVDLGAVAKVTQVSTQGYPTASGVKVSKKDKCWVESYTLAFSTDGSQWQKYTENGVVKVFKGNSDNNSVVINSISKPVEARFVRFIPQSWKNSIALRVEVYGEVTDLDLTAVTPPPSSPTVESEEPVHEVILEEEEEAEMEEFVCGEKEELDQQDAWEEDTVNSVMETASQIQSKVAVVSRSPSSMTDLAVEGEKQTPKSKRKSKKPKQEKPEENEGKKRKKKKKKVKERKTKGPLVSSLSLLEEVEEEEGASSSEEEEQEQQEEEAQISSPSLPEIPKRPESVKRLSPAPKRSISMFPDRKESADDPSKPRRRRAQTDDSIRKELSRQQLAEDRRKKLAAAMDKPKREIQAQNPEYSYSANGDLDDFLTKYCIISEGQANYYRRIFKTFDENKDGFLFPEEVLEALESVNSHLLSDSHINYIYRVLELCDCSLDAGADFKLFSVVAAFSQRVAVLDEFAKILISKLDFRELDFKLQRAKRLFLCYVDEAKKTISLEELILGLTAGGLTADQKEQTLKVLGRTAALDFLDFLTYIPLFIHIHDHILQDPLGTVVYRDMLAV